MKVENLGDDDIALQIESYTRRLLEYPQQAVLATIRRWPEENRFWPAWADLNRAVAETLANQEAADLRRRRLAHMPEPTPEQRESARRQERWQRMSPSERRAEIEASLAMITPEMPLGQMLRKLGESILARMA